MYEEVILVGNKCDYDRKSWEVDTQTGKEVKQHCFFFCFFFKIFWLANFKNTIQLLYTKVPTYPGVLYIQVFVVRLADGYSEWVYER